MVSKITTLEDVKLFAQHLVNDLHLNFHPDDDFACYRNYDTKQPTFSAAEAAQYNALMNECFEVLRKGRCRRVRNHGAVLTDCRTCLNTNHPCK